MVDNLVYGGLETHIATLLNGLSKNHNVHLISQRLSQELYELLDNNVKVLELPYNIEAYTNYIKDNNIDVLHGHPVEAVSISSIIGNSLNIPVCITYHGLYGWNWSIHNKIDKIIAVSNEVKDKLLNNDKNLNIELIQNGIDNNKFLKQKEYNHELPILFIGRLDPDKYYCLKTIIESMRELSSYNLSLTVAGSGPYIDELLRNKPNFVNSVGYINDMYYLNEIINNCSIVYGTGRGIREAMLCGRVCISLDACGYDGIIKSNTIDDIEYVNFSGRSKIKKTTIKENILNDLRYLLDNTNEQYKISEWSVDYASNKYTLNKFIESHTDVYNSLIKR
jgi:glycosyltransferase involved in cell wall biosynthesis